MPLSTVELRMEAASVEVADNYTFTDTTLIQLIGSSQLTFIQTDKPIYKPGQTGVCGGVGVWECGWCVCGGVGVWECGWCGWCVGGGVCGCVWGGGVGVGWVVWCVCMFVGCVGDCCV